MEGGDCALPCSAVWRGLLQKLYTLPLNQLCSFRPSQSLVLFHRWTGRYDQYDLLTSLKLQRHCQKQTHSTFSAYIAFTHNSMHESMHLCVFKPVGWNLEINLVNKTWFFYCIKLPNSPQTLEIVKATQLKTSGPYVKCTEKATLRR